MESNHLYEVSLVHTLTHFDTQIALGGIRHGRGRLDRGIGEQAADKLFGIGAYEPLPCVENGWPCSYHNDPPKFGATGYPLYVRTRGFPHTMCATLLYLPDIA